MRRIRGSQQKNIAKCQYCNRGTRCLKRHSYVGGCHVHILQCNSQAEAGVGWLPVFLRHPPVPFKGKLEEIFKISLLES